MTITLHRAALAAALAVVAACAPTTGGSPVGSAPVPVTVSTPTSSASAGTSQLTVVVGGAGQTVKVGATRDKVWPLLPGAYEFIGIPLGFKDDGRFRLGNEQAKVRRAVNGVQMRAIVDCGSDLNGEKADSYDIRLTIETTVAPSAAGDSAEVTTTLSGLGRSPNFGNNDVTCTTKGELERRILRYVRIQLGLRER